MMGRIGGTYLREFKNGGALQSHFSELGTGGVEQRFAVLDQLHPDHAAQLGMAGPMGGCLDAPERIPSGQTIVYFAGTVMVGGRYICDTKPGAVARA